MSSAIWVSTGVLLAAFLAWIAVIAFPEDRSILGIKAHEQIDYNLLPYNSSLANLERGRSYYIQLCALCHGADGSGNGEYSYRMVPKPSNLVSSVIGEKTDEELSAVIRDGIAGTAMQGWKNSLNEIQRKQIIDYIRYLALQHSHQ